MRVKKIFVLIFTVCLSSLFVLSSSQAVTFSSNGGKGNIKVVKKKQSQKTYSKSKSSGSISLDLPEDEKKRITDAFEMVRLTGIQAKLALQELTDLDGKIVSVPEVKARLTYAEGSLQAWEKASNKLESSVKIAELAYGGSLYRENSILLLFQATPAWAWGTKDALKSLSSAAKTMGNYASKLKNTVKNGLGHVTGAVGFVHTKIGNLVGKKGWTTIMATTKLFAAVGGACAGVAAVAPATAIGGAFGVVIFLAGTATAAASYANDLAIINETSNSSVSKLDSNLTNLNSGLGVLAILLPATRPGTAGDLFVSVIGVTGNDIVATTPGSPLSKKDMKKIISENDGKMDKHGYKKSYKKPVNIKSGGEGDDGHSGSSGGGCSGGY